MKKIRLSKRAIIGLFVVAGLLITGGISWNPLIIRYRLSKAKTALEARDAKKALVWLHANERIAPGHAENHFWLARAYRRLGRFKEVREHLESSLKQGYSKEMIKREQWLAFAQNGQLKEAEPHLAELLRDPKGDGREICEAFVSGYLLHNRNGRALQILNAWQKDFPQDAYPYFIRGKIWEGAGNNKKAIVNFRQALDRDSTLDEARLRVAMLLMGQHQYEEAGNLFQQCLKNDSDNPDILTGWSQWLTVMDRKNEAREVLSRALKIDPKHLKARTAMGQMELSSGNPEKALRWLMPLAKEVPHNRSVRYTLARALQRAGRAKEAEEHFKFAENAEAASTQIQSWIDQLQNDPDNVAIRYQIGSTLMKFGNPIEAVFWLRSVLEIDGQHQLAHQALADYYAIHGPSEMEKHHRQMAEKLSKKSAGM